MSKYAETYRATPNVSKGTNQRKGVIFHHTAGTYVGSVSWLTDKTSNVSAHVVIARDGRRTVLASDEAITWHAGHGRWRGMNPNHIALGVEFELTSTQVRDNASLTQDQLDSMLEWLEPRWRQYGWSMDDMTHHRAVDPLRKIDLSEDNWTLVRDAIYNHFSSPTILYSVDIDGKRDGVYRDPITTIQQAIARRATDIRIKRI